jgi:hypothetical protein
MDERSELNLGDLPTVIVPDATFNFGFESR